MKKFITIFLSALILIFFPNVSVKADTGKLIMDKVSTSSNTVQPGDKFKLNFSLQNNTGYTVENVIIKLVGIEGKNSLGGFSPVGTTNEIYCNNLSKGNSEQVSIDLISDPSLKAGTYNLIVDLKYNIRHGATYEDTKIVGVVLNNKSNMLITSLDTDDGSSSGTDKKVNVNFVNAGKTNLNEVMVTITANDKKYVKYFGEVDIDDENNFEQKLPLDGDINGKVEITYVDDMNIQGKITQDFIIKAPSADKLKAAKDSKKSIWASITSFLKGLFGMGD